MKVLLFQPRFAALVAAGTKRQTIRPMRKRPIRVGDELSLRRWSGAAYRSRQILLRNATCTGVFGIHVRRDNVFLDAGKPPLLLEEFARQDGFKFFAEMAEWFKRIHGLPFSGVLIAW